MATLGMGVECKKDSVGERTLSTLENGVNIYEKRINLLTEKLIGILSFEDGNIGKETQTQPSEALPPYFGKLNELSDMMDSLNDRLMRLIGQIAL